MILKHPATLWKRVTNGVSPIKSTWYVGINSPIPLAPLQVGADNAAEQITMGTLVPKLLAVGGNNSTTEESLLRLVRRTSSSNYYPASVDFKVLSYGTPGSPWLPKTQLNIALKATGSYDTGSVVDVMTLRDNGYVGIGTTAPGYTLDVAGIIRARGAFYSTQVSPINTFVFNGTSSTLHSIYSNSTVDVSLGANNSTTQLYLKSGGNVGIGTASPISALDLFDGVLSRYNSSWTGLQNSVIIPTQNILAFADKMSTYTITCSSAPDSGAIANMFDSATGTGAYWYDAKLPVTIQIDYDKQYNLNHLFGVGFYSIYFAKKIKIEVYNAVTPGWETVADTSSNVNDSYSIYSYRNYVTSIKFTLDSSNSGGYIYVTNLLDGNTMDRKGYYLSRGGDTMLGDLTVKGTTLPLLITRSTGGTVATFQNTDINNGCIATFDRASNVRQATMAFSLSGTNEWGVGIPGGPGGTPQTGFGITQGTVGVLANSKLFIDTAGNTGIGVTAPATKLDIAGSMQVSSAVALSLGGYVRTFAEATGTPTGTTTYFDIAVNVPTGCKLLGTQLRVDTALTAGETWGAAYVTGSATVLAAAGQAVAKNTKVNKVHVDEITTATTLVRITRDAGNFTDAAGVIRAIVYYETLTAMGSAA